MSESNVSSLKRPEATIRVNRETGPLLLELVSKAVIGGEQAHLLADLYAQVKAAFKAVTGDEA